MVCKKFQVYNWFRTLDGAKRIDFLNGMLHICFPLELRFLGSCIEELARKDYTYLRDAEIKANAAYEIQQMRDISDKITRSKMIVTLALLASSNYECARLIYDLLNVDIPDLLDKMKPTLDEKIADEFLLLLTMAANHPAFDFQMKTKMSQLCINAEKKLKQFKVILKESESDLCLCSMNSPDEYASSKDIKERNVPNTDESADKVNVTISTDAPEINNNTLIKPKKDENTDSKLDGHEDDINNDKETFKQALIESIDFEGVQMIQGTDNYKFLIKIRWSDKEYNVIDKTYSELCEFNKQLLSLYPKELNGLIESSQLVFKEDQKEDVIKELPLVTDYCSKIASLPKLVSESEFLRSFFRSNLSNSSIAIANESNSPNKPSAITPSSNTSDLSSSQETNDAKPTNNSNINSNPSQETYTINKNQRNNLGTINETHSDDNKEKNKNTTKTTYNKEPQQQEIKCDSTPSGQNFSDMNETFNDSISETKSSNQTSSSVKRLNQSTNENPYISSVTSLPMHINTQMSYPVNISRPNSTNSSSNQVLPTPISGLVPQQQILNPNALFNPIQPPFLNMNQQLHLQAFQPIQNIMITSPSCPSPSHSTSASVPNSSIVLNTHSLNNSRSNSPWNHMMPPPPPGSSAGGLPSLMPQQHHHHPHAHHAQLINPPPQFAYSPHPYQLNSYSTIPNPTTSRPPPPLDRQTNEFIASNFKSNTHNSFNNKSNSKSQQQQQQINDEALVRCATESSLNSKMQLQSQTSLTDESQQSFDEITAAKSNEQTSFNQNRKSSDAFKKNISKSKNNQLPSDTLVWHNNLHESSNATNENDLISPKFASINNNNSKETTNNSNNKSTSSNQSLPSSLTLPLHMQQSQQHQKQQPKLISPYQNNPVMTTFNTSAPPPPLPPNYHSNTLLIQGNSHLLNLHSQSESHIMTNPQTNSLMLAPLMSSSSSSIAYGTASLPPTHPSLSQQQQQQQQQTNMKYLSKQNSNRMQMERPKSPAVSNLTSDDENNDKKHNRRSSLRSSSTNSNNKYSVTRQHNSHSISSTATTIKPSSVSNASSNSSLNSANTNPRVTCSNGSLSASPSSQQNPNSQSVSPINNSNGKATNQKNTNSKLASNGNNDNSSLSPQALNNDKTSDNTNESNKHKKSETNTENTSTAAKDRLNVPNNQNSTSSSSSTSSANLTNQQTKSPNVSNLIPIPQQQQQIQQQQHHMHQYQSIPAQSQPSSLSSSSSMSNNNLYYSPVVSPFTYIDSTNISFALANGLPGTTSGNHPLTPAIIHQFNPYQPPPPPPPPSQSAGQNTGSYQHQLIQSQHQPPYFNLIPVIQPPPPTLVAQQQAPPPQQSNSSSSSASSSSCPTQTSSHSNSNTNTNCTTPTPGSSPNPTLSSSSSSSNSSTNLNLNTMPNQATASTIQFSQLAHPPPPQSFPFEQQLLNPYGFNMMALANTVANSATQQLMNPNIVMMMMMQNQHPSGMPPLMPNQMQPPPPSAQVLTTNAANSTNGSHGKYNTNNAGYQHFQQYRSQTPNSLQQPSPSNLMSSSAQNASSGSFRTNYQQQASNKKKLSCYNCGMMNHTAKDCDQPSLETMSQPTQYKLNFKMNNPSNMPMMNSNMNSTNSTANNNMNSDHLEDVSEAKMNNSSSSTKTTNSVTSTTTNSEL